MLALAPAAHALSVGSTICYSADGTPTLNPPNPDDFSYCVTRTGTSGSTSGGSGGPVLCTVDLTTGLYRNCTPLQPLQG